MLRRHQTPLRLCPIEPRQPGDFTVPSCVPRCGDTEQHIEKHSGLAQGDAEGALMQSRPHPALQHLHFCSDKSQHPTCSMWVWPPWQGCLCSLWAPRLLMGIRAVQPPGPLAQAVSHPSALLSHPRLPDYFNEDNDSHLGNSHPLTITILISFHYKSETASLTFKTLAIGNSIAGRTWVGWRELWEGWARLKGAGGMWNQLVGGSWVHTGHREKGTWAYSTSPRLS